MMIMDRTAYNENRKLWFATQKKIATWNAFISTHPKAGFPRHGGPSFARHDSRGSGKVLHDVTPIWRTRAPIWESNETCISITYFVP